MSEASTTGESSSLPSPAEAFVLFDAAEKEATEANRLAGEKKNAKDRAKAIAQASLEASNLESASTRLDMGEESRRVLFYLQEKRHFNVTNKPAFREWAQDEDEDYFEPERRIREDLVRQECERRMEDGEELPPGVTTYTETKIHRQAM